MIGIRNVLGTCFGNGAGRRDHPTTEQPAPRHGSAPLEDFPLSPLGRRLESHAPRHGVLPPAAGNAPETAVHEGLRSAGATLHWPDGRTSNGVVERTGLGDAFRVDPRSKVIRNRSNQAQEGDGSSAAPRALAVTREGDHWSPALPSLSDLHFMKNDGGKLRLQLAGGVSQLRTMDADIALLAQLANVAGGRGDGVDDTQSIVLLKLLAECANSIANRCADPEAALKAAKALAAPFAEVRFQGGPDCREAYGTVSGVLVNQKFSELGPGQVSAEVAALAPGEHRFVNVVHVDSEQGVHEMALSMTKLADDRARLTIINSNGWSGIGNGVSTAISKTLETGDACRALENLLAGQMPARPAGGRESKWRAPENGMPLLAWLTASGPAESKLETTFHATPFKSKPQKADDCAVESKLAWLATVMPPADYKLAKATFLACLKELGKTQGDLHPKAEKRLNKRITTSLSGSTVAPGSRMQFTHNPAGTPVPEAPRSASVAR